MLLSHRTHLRVTAAAAGAAQPVVPRSVLAGSSSSSGRRPTTRNAALSCSRLGLQQQQPLVPSAPTARPIGYGFTSSSSSSSSSTGLAPSVGSRQSTIMRSFLGVGAPEAILVAVVALVVFGPKGLADAAKSVGQTLRAFQPTIKEVVEVSQEIKGTLEQELGLDELRNAATMRPTPRPMPPSTSTSASASTSSGDETAAAAAAGGADAGEASSSSSSSNPGLRAISEDMAKQLDPDIELKRAMSEQAAWGGQLPAAAAADPVAAVAAAAAAAAPAAGGDSKAAGKDLSTLSLEELEAELARRKKA